MQTYDHHIKTGHQLAAMGLKRPLSSVAPDSMPTAGASSAGAPGGVVAVAFKPTSAPALDGVDRVASFATPDPQHRIGVGKVTGPLGWDGSTALVATCGLGRVTVTAGAPSSPAQAPVTLDGKGRLRLSPTGAAVLRLDPASQVLAVAVPATGQLVLMSADTALAQLTGPVRVDAPAAAHPDEGEVDERAAHQQRRTDVRRRFRPAEDVA